MGLSDIIWDIDITSNRPDCLNMMGVAREISVIENAGMKKPTAEIKNSSEKISASISIEDREGCERYAGRVIKNVKIGPSPEWLVRRLESVGSRSINNVVDITNFVMLECGQPLHAFDYDKLAGHQIVVRRSKAGEKFQTLDSKFHELNDDAVMICDSEKTIAIGGIMGGMNSEISDTTINVLLESAYFNPKRIRRAAKHLGIASEAANRFGRGVDPDGTLYALDRAAYLMQEIAGGSVCDGILDVNYSNYKPTAIPLKQSSITKLLGKEIPMTAALPILERLGCQVHKISDSESQVTPPSYRIDLTIEPDLIEEVARIYGYDNIEATSGSFIHYQHDESKPERFGRELRSALRESGFSEVATNSMVSSKSQFTVFPEVKLVNLMNPISEDMAVMRASLLPSVLEVVRGNLHRKNFDVMIYEIGRVFRDIGKELPLEETRIVGCVTGSRAPIHWTQKPETTDFYDIKGVVSQLMDKFWLDSISFNPYNSQVFASNSVTISHHKQVLGHLGKLQPVWLRQFDIDETVWCFELDHAKFLEAARFKKSFDMISRYPFVARDLALTVDLGLKAGDLVKSIKGVGGPHLQRLDVFDVYSGNQIAGDKKSIAFALSFQSAERTLTEEEIDQTMQRIISKVEGDHGAKLR